MCANDSAAKLELSEEVSSKKGYFLLIPWMLVGAVWLQINTTLDKSLIEFYFSLLLVASISLLFGDKIDPTFASDLKRIKLLPFLTFYAFLCAGVFVLFTVVAILTQGSITTSHMMPEVMYEYLALTILIIAPVETVMFQFVLPKITSLTLKTIELEKYGGVLSQATFGIFHFAAYSHNWMTMLTASLLGVFFYALVKMNPEWGMGAAMGAHAGWNIGITVFMMTGVGMIFGMGYPIGG